MDVRYWLISMNKQVSVIGSSLVLACVACYLYFSAADLRELDPLVGPAEILEAKQPEAVNRPQTGSSVARQDAAASAVVSPTHNQVGSEGYGVHIDRAIASKHPSEALVALTWLVTCKNIATSLSNFQRVFDASPPDPSLTQFAQSLQAESRRCQTVTLDHHRAVHELAAMARNAHEQGVSLLHAQAVDLAALGMEERISIGKGVLKDASAGHEASMQFVAFSGALFGIEPLERLVFLEAFDQLSRPRDVKDFQFETLLGALGIDAAALSPAQRAGATQRASELALLAKRKSSLKH